MLKQERTPNRSPTHRLRVRIATSTILLYVLTTVNTATAQEDEEDEPIIDLSGVTDAITDFTSSFSDTVTDILHNILYQPFIDFLEAAANHVLDYLIWLPDTTNSVVLDIHQDVFTVSLLLSGVALTAIGFIYMLHEPFGISYSRVRPLIPRLLAALAFGSVAPWALNYPVNLSEQMASALAPQTMDFSGMLMLSGELILVTFFQSIVLLIVLAILMVQKVFIYYGAALAPLLAVFWALPFKYTKSIAERFIGAWWGFVLLPIFMVIAFRLSIALLSVGEVTAASWVVGLGGVLLLLGIPYIVVSAGMSAVAPAAAVSAGAASTISRRTNIGIRRGSTRQTQLNDYRNNSTGSYNPTQQRENRFDKEAILDDD